VAHGFFVKHEYNPRDSNGVGGPSMPLSFETKTLTVGELFSGGNVFRMPIFQRPYSRDEETAVELFGDIDQAMVKSNARSGGTYFLGPMIVAQSSSSVPFEIVDGQQRLATLSAIFAILLPPGRLQQELQESLRRRQSPLRGLPEESRVRLRSLIDRSSKSGFKDRTTRCHCLKKAKPKPSLLRVLVDG
jgi:hypothetical protein